MPAEHRGGLAEVAAEADHLDRVLLRGELGEDLRAASLLPSSTNRISNGSDIPISEATARRTAGGGSSSSLQTGITTESLFSTATAIGAHGPLS
jgi:hypothetical protein